jgi:hypothetical protein
MQRFDLKKFASEIIGYTKHYPFIEKVYFERESNWITIYLFINDFNKFPENISNFEEKLEVSFPPYRYRINVIPYTKSSVEHYADNFDLLPVRT